MDIYAQRTAPHYRAVSTYHLNDNNLSLAAKGMLTMMLCYQKGTLTLERLQKSCAESLEELDRLIDEIEAAGYAMVIDTEITVIEKPTNKAKNRQKKRTTAFVPPTLQEVTDYIREKGYHFSPEEFVDHYESNGWHVGRVKMSRWKAACGTFERTWLKDHPQEADYNDWE